ncbi:hypothetical protein GCM10007989_31080 [Devosia pacifica]|uniref:Response regulatory domain-containing protein n=1 Tax=Devosia pacifica TaxID=1335967 RepID=A0A918VXG4_9HYPH|nr:response regulator [Devosia pacifica]GHA32737.1 hypothetical protein GCM10007989_31080 [Devosia pacifica]
MLRNTHVHIFDDDTLFAEQIAQQLQDLYGTNAWSRSDVDLHSNDMVHNPDCIIVDHDLGQSNGLELAQRLREQYGALVPIIMLTGVGNEQLAVQAFKSGFADYLPKRHLDIGALASAIHDAITRASEAGASLVPPPSGIGMLSPGYLKSALLKAQREQGIEEMMYLRVELEEFALLHYQYGHTMAERVRRSFIDSLGRLPVSGGYFAQIGTRVSVFIFEKTPTAAEIEQLRNLVSYHLSSTTTLNGRTVQITPRLQLGRLKTHPRSIDKSFDEMILDSEHEYRSSIHG